MQMIADSLRKLEAGRGLTREEAEAAMEELLAGRLAHGDIVRLLTSLRDKGETVDELVGFARAMRRHAVQIFPEAQYPRAVKIWTGTEKSSPRAHAADSTWRTDGVCRIAFREQKHSPCTWLAR